MFFRRYGTFAGGIDLPDEKQDTLGLAIESYKPADPLRVPLAVCGRSSAKPLVEPGQLVSLGERIAESCDSMSVDVFSPVAGKVVAVVSAEVAPVDRFVACAVIEILPDKQTVVLTEGDVSSDWQAFSPEDLMDRIGAGGLTTYRRPIEPLVRWIDRARSKGCRALIANVMENQPYVTADHRLLVERPTEVVDGLVMLASVLNIQEIALAVDWRRAPDYQGVVSPAKQRGISLVALPHKYPAGSDAMVTKVITRREKPPGGSVMDVGVAVVGAATCLATYRWVACGLPPIGRVVTVAGRRAARAMNSWLPFGARCLSLVADVEQPVIQNGPMVGVRCSSQGVISPATNAILAIDASVPASPSPCIRCSWCTDHCPARLNVAALNDAFELGALDRASRLVASGCLECGVCTYVCPARLPLSQRVKYLKRAVMSGNSAMPLFAKG